jgi:beta-barrel assembly-enhancing protease
MRALRIALLVPLLASASCISEEREREIGDRLASDVNPHLPLIEDPLLSTYVQTVGSKIAGVSERPHLEYRFYLIDTDAINAFALPGGHVYLTRGLIERTEDGAEFAGVLAHEIAHVAAGHGVRRLQRQLRTGSLVNVLYDMFLGGEPAVLRENSLQLANQAWSARHSRRDEQEADRLAVEYLIATGIDPAGVVTLLETLLLEEEYHTRDADRMTEWLSSHPLTSRRIEDAREDIVRLEEGEPVPVSEVSVEAFPAFKLLVMRWGGNDSGVIPE